MICLLSASVPSYCVLNTGPCCSETIVQRHCGNNRLHMIGRTVGTPRSGAESEQVLCSSIHLDFSTPRYIHRSWKSNESPRNVTTYVMEIIYGSVPDRNTLYTKIFLYKIMKPDRDTCSSAPDSCMHLCSDHFFQMSIMILSIPMQCRYQLEPFKR